MRVAVDFKVVSTEAAMRGMGRYTQQQIREVLSQDPHLELFLFMHGPVPPQNALFDWGLFPNVHTIPVTVDGHDLNYTKMPDFGTILAYSHRIQQLLRRLEVDVFHNTVPFMYPYYSAITVCPVVTTFYDSIPLIFPSDYFVSRDQRLNYLRAMENVTDSARVVAISQSAASDLHLYTGYSPANTHIAYPLIDSTFRHIEDERILQSPIEGRDANSRVDSQRLPERFILSVTGIHRAKNVSVLLDAFKKASRELGEDWGLIIVLPSDYAQTTFTDRFGSPPGVITLRDVSEEGLCLLYNKATMVAQPSTYEGFGYPVAEAMSCGAAVIATDTSSIPEVAGDAAILVSPSDARPLAAAMILLARHPELRSELKRRALRRSKNFSDPRPLGAVTLEAYRGAAGDSGRNALGQPAAPALVRPRVAVWSSMPPLDCGVADYTSELVDALSQTHDVSVYVDGTYATTPPRAPHVRFRHPRDCTIDKEPAPNIFQVGARTYQEFMYPYIRKHGGTMVLHDLAMALGFYWLAKSSGSMNEFEDEIVWPEGLHALEAYARLDLNLTLPPREVQERFFLHHKMLQWLIGRSDRILVHTEPLRRKLLSEYPSANPGVVRMGVVDTTPMQRYLPRTVFRHAIGLGANDLCVGCFGIVDRVKRIELVIRAFDELCTAYPGSLLVIAGRCHDPVYKQELRSQISASTIASRILMLDYVPHEGFHTLMTLADVVVNLRSPERLGLSAVLLRALAAAKPVITSAIDEWQIFPDGTCLWVEQGDKELAKFLEHLMTLADSKSLRDQYGSAARRWFLENATISHMVAAYMDQADSLRDSHSRNSSVSDPVARQAE